MRASPAVAAGDLPRRIQTTMCASFTHTLRIGILPCARKNSVTCWRAASSALQMACLTVPAGMFARPSAFCKNSMGLCRNGLHHLLFIESKAPLLTVPFQPPHKDSRRSPYGITTGASATKALNASRQNRLPRYGCMPFGPCLPCCG